MSTIAETAVEKFEIITTRDDFILSPLGFYDVYYKSRSRVLPTETFFLYG